jgi:hypothetical protein
VGDDVAVIIGMIEENLNGIEKQQGCSHFYRKS